MSSRSMIAALCIAFAWLNGCAQDERDAVVALAQPILYGADDREEIAALDEEDPVRSAGVDAVAALVAKDRIGEDGERIAITSPSWREDRELCAGVRFAEQPAIALCSAFLVADDVVLTAGHCARLCSTVKLVFGAYYERPGQLRELTRRDVYDCADVLADASSADDVDFAWLRLDRPVERERAAIALRPEPPAIGESLSLVGFPGGVPMKADAGGVVTGLARGRFFTSHDAFQSSSGGPVLDELGQAVGILGGGAQDLERTAAGCYQPIAVPVDPELAPVGRERSTRVDVAVAALCAEDPCEPVCRAYAAEDRCRQPVRGCSLASGARPAPAAISLVAGLLLAVMARSWRPVRGRARPRAEGSGLELPRAGGELDADFDQGDMRPRTQRRAACAAAVLRLLLDAWARRRRSLGCEGPARGAR